MVARGRLMGTTSPEAQWVQQVQDMRSSMQQQQSKRQLRVWAIWKLPRHLWLAGADALSFLHGWQQHGPGMRDLLSLQNMCQPSLHTPCLECEYT